MSPRFHCATVDIDDFDKYYDIIGFDKQVFQLFGMFDLEIVYGEYLRTDQPFEEQLNQQTQVIFYIFDQTISIGTLNPDFYYLIDDFFIHIKAESPVINYHDFLAKLGEIQTMILSTIQIGKKRSRPQFSFSGQVEPTAKIQKTNNKMAETMAELRKFDNSKPTKPVQTKPKTTLSDIENKKINNILTNNNNVTEAEKSYLISIKHFMIPQKKTSFRIKVSFTTTTQQQQQEGIDEFSD